MRVLPAQFGAGWVWPFWLDRQLDPTSPAFVAQGQLPFFVNLTARNWTTLGTLRSPAEAVVDPRGLVTRCAGGWSLDWWVGADDRWHLPAREPAVRQRLVADAPVVETAMRVPGGDVFHRAFAAGGEGAVVVEVENATPVPVAVAFAVRPYHPGGLAGVGRIGLVDGDRTVTVDGRVAVALPRPPGRAAGSTLADGDVAEVVLSGRAGSALRDGLRCRDGMATAAFVYPLPHTATIRVVLPPAPPARGRRRRRGRDKEPGLPSAEAVARGWRAHAARGMRLVLPDERLARSVEANRRFLLLRPAGDEVTPCPAVSLLGALDRYGYAGEVAEVLASRPQRQRPDGYAVHAMAEHWRLHRDEALVTELAPAVARGAEGMVRSRPDDLWSRRGLGDAAELLAAAGEEKAAAAASRMADARRPVPPEGAPGGPGDVRSLAACWPLRLLPAEDPALVAVAEAVRQRHLIGPAVVGADGHSGLDTSATLALALYELEAGDRRTLDRLAWMLDVATPTWTWPEAVHPRLPGGCAGDGHHLPAGADLLNLVRNLLVRETTDGGLALCTLLPGGWHGGAIEVDDAPTTVGRLSFAVRWHGPRPALLWELDPHLGVGPVRITAPGLDPAWSSGELRGEALLDLVPPATGAGAGMSFS